MSPPRCFNVQVSVNGRNADPAVLAAKLARVHEAHVAPLNDLADKIADAKGLPRSHVPYIDPDSGWPNGWNRWNPPVASCSATSATRSARPFLSWRPTWRPSRTA